ncbi:MAG TPA: hypothetical protein VH796_12805 [Nitrososphaeraceae archaeon]
MKSVEEWRKWTLRQLIGNGIHNVLSENQIRLESGRHYEMNLEYAIRSLMDRGIIMSLESNHERRYVVNFDKLDLAQQMLNSVTVQEPEIIQPYMAEPDGYVYWFDNTENDRNFKGQNIYRFYVKKTDSLNFAVQLLAKPIGNAKTIMMGSLNDSDSYISRLWIATANVSAESIDGSFILQNLQDKDRIACGNNRQRGKIALDIFRKLGYIQKVGSKGNSTKFKLTGTRPFTVTLDEIFTQTR